MKISLGFSLLEILIVLAIASILSLISIPLYSQHIVKERRLEAAMTLQKLAIALEQFYSFYHTYENATLVQLEINDKIVNNHYQLAIASSTDHDFKIEARPLNDQAKKDLNCGTLVLNSYGEKSITGTGTVAECW